MSPSTTGKLTPSTSLTGRIEGFDPSGAIVCTLEGHGGFCRLHLRADPVHTVIDSGELRVAHRLLTEVTAEDFGQRSAGGLEIEASVPGKTLELRNGSARVTFAVDLTAATDDVLATLIAVLDKGATDAGL